MAYRLRLTKKQLGDFVIMLFFDKLFDETLLEENEKFNEIFEKLETLGLKGFIFQKFFDVDPSIRSKYKQFRKNFDKDNGSVSIIMTENEVEEDYSDYRELIVESIKRITGKENPDPEKVQEFTNKLINDIVYTNEGE